MKEMMKEMQGRMGSCSGFMKERMGQGRAGMCGPGTESDKEPGFSHDYSNQELCTLFEEWLGSLEEEILEFGKGTELSSENISNEFIISEESAELILAKLVREKRYETGSSSKGSEE